jgi:hypothetical protein
VRGVVSTMSPTWFEKCVFPVVPRNTKSTGSSTSAIVYLSDEDVYRCPADEKLKYHYSNEEDGQKLRN